MGSCWAYDSYHAICDNIWETIINCRILPSHIFVGDTDTSVVVDDLLVLVGLLVIH